MIVKKNILLYSYKCMNVFPIFILIISIFLNSSCVQAHEPNLTPPISSYVKVYKEIEIISCSKSKKDCPIGKYRQSGSGINIFINKYFPICFT